MSKAPIRAGDVISFRNLKEDNKGNVSAYDDGVYLALGDEIGNFIPAIKMTKPEGDYYSAIRKTLDTSQSVTKNIDCDSRTLVREFVEALERFATIPAQYKQRGEKLPYVDYIYSNAKNLADEIRILLPDPFRPVNEEASAPVETTYNYADTPDERAVYFEQDGILIFAREGHRERTMIALIAVLEAAAD